MRGRLERIVRPQAHEDHGNDPIRDRREDVFRYALKIASIPRTPITKAAETGPIVSSETIRMAIAMAVKNTPKAAVTH